MRAPEFWTHGRGPWPILLSPASILWQAAAARRQQNPKTYRAPVPVICIGNLTVGGSGKTPVALAVGARLWQSKIKAHFLIRGYGGSLKGPARVEMDRHTATDVGDEALLLGRAAPTWVGGDRSASARAAVAAGAEMLVMDDGHQNTDLFKDLSLIVIDRAYGFGNGRVMPAGPLRETVSGGLERADAVIALDGGDGGDREDWQRYVAAAGLPVLAAAMEPGADNEAVAGKRILAFAGIGRPEKFFASLEQIGCDVAARVRFPDHHAYDADEIMRLVEKAAEIGAVPVTTAKDAVRLPVEARPMIQVLQAGVSFDDPEALDQLLEPLKTKALAGDG